MRLRSVVRQQDWLLLLAVGFLVATGYLLLRSIDQANHEVDFSLGTHAFAILIGLALAVVTMRTDLVVWNRVSTWLYFAMLAGLVAVPFYGDTIQGAQRWIDLGWIQFQPSEIAKLALLLLVARIAHRYKNNINKPWPLILIGLYTVVPIALILAQPDLGTAILLLAIVFCILVASHLKKTTLLLIIGVMVVGAALSYPLLADYQRERIQTFLNPLADPQGAGYNVTQSTIAIGSGGLLGKGLDSGSQSQLNFLPSQHTDFVFAAMAEKLGFVGGALVIMAYLAIVWRALKVAASSPTDFGRYLCIGIAFILGFQAVVNIGMNLGLLPVTGVPLPLVSYGGTHMIIELVMIGLVLSVKRASNKL